MWVADSGWEKLVLNLIEKIMITLDLSWVVLSLFHLLYTFYCLFIIARLYGYILVVKIKIWLPVNLWYRLIIINVAQIKVNTIRLLSIPTSSEPIIERWNDSASRLHSIQLLIRIALFLVNFFLLFVYVINELLLY